jgi:L-asparaginase/Glu-tRNA(Gln) amidotransferase subunit D
MTAYYARPISIDDTPQAARDMALILAMGFEPYPIGEEKAAVLEEYRKIGMDAFRPYVESSVALIFRAFPDGSIGAGVAKEIAWALEKGIPVVEFPRQIERRTLDVNGTRAMLAELGQR